MKEQQMIYKKILNSLNWLNWIKPIHWDNLHFPKSSNNNKNNKSSNK